MGSYEQYLDDVAAIRTVGTSTDGWVTVIREASGDLDVQIRPGMLHRCTADQVTAEIRSGLLAALTEHRRQFRDLRITYFGSPLGVTPFVPPPAPATAPDDPQASPKTREGQI